MKREITITINVEISDSFETDDTIGRIYYPNEGNKIQIIKGLNSIEFSDTVHHEIGHLFDWYLSNGIQSKDVNIRETNANIIGEGLRFKKSLL